jgi:hypothetical protein
MPIVSGSGTDPLAGVRTELLAALELLSAPGDRGP